MNKIMIASDLHGSSYFVNNMVNLFKNEQCDTLVLLGDLLYHGPRNDLPFEYEVKTVANLLNEISDKILSVRGNCDGEVDQNMFDFPILQNDLIFSIDGFNFFATHGHKYNENNLPSFKNIDILLNGHFHIPAFIKHQDYIYINPGSVSIPKNNSTNSCIIYHNKNFSFYDIKNQNNYFVYREELI